MQDVSPRREEEAKEAERMGFLCERVRRERPTTGREKDVRGPVMVGGGCEERNEERKEKTRRAECEEKNKRGPRRKEVGYFLKKRRELKTENEGGG